LGESNGYHGKIDPSPETVYDEERLRLITGVRIMASNTGRMSVSISPEKQAKLDAVAANADRSRSYIVNEAIDNYLDLYDWQTRRIEERLERAQSGDAKWIPHDEVFDRLEAKIKARLEPAP
jgi:predicted transcriptional regulator